SNMNAAPPAREPGMRPPFDNQKRVPPHATIRTCVAFAREPYSLAIACARLDAEFQRLAPGHYALAVPGCADGLSLAGTVAARTLDVELHPAAHLRHLAGALAFGTLDAS